LFEQIVICSNKHIIICSNKLQFVQTNCNLFKQARSTDENQDFFSKIAARRRQHAFQPESTISAEIDRFLTHHEPYPTGKVLNVKMALAAFPTIRQMFVDLNTGLPASAAVERLFSLGGRVFTPLRTRMTSHHFEMMMFLRLSKNF